jgi:predicted amidohydrolase
MNVFVWLMRLFAAPVLFSVVVPGCAAPADSASPADLRRGECSIRVAGIVLKWVPGNKEANYTRAEPLIRQAAARGADLVITTECFRDGYAIRHKEIPIEQWRELGEVIPGGPYLKRLQSLADELNIHLIAGMMELDGEQTDNTAVVIGPEGQLIGKYRKQCLGH